jgi:hypothetical protein
MSRETCNQFFCLPISQTCVHVSPLLFLYREIKESKGNGYYKAVAHARLFRPRLPDFCALKQLSGNSFSRHCGASFLFSY